MNSGGTEYDRSFYDEQRQGSLKSARKFVPLLIETFAPASVVDVGCGVGTWLSQWVAHGINDVLGVDGDYVERESLLIPPELFVARDLEQRIALDRRFDLAASLEVAEHLSPARADSFVADLVALAPVVVFSAAIPHQGGTSHINERWQDYWAALFAEHRYAHLDFLRPAFWNEADVDVWYRQNTVAYAHEDYIDQRPALQALRQRQPERVLNLVHPQLIEYKVDALTFKEALWLALTAGRDAVRRRVGLPAPTRYIGRYYR